ncbi:MAG TPA: carbon-nitrogen hydrolase family protein [Kofleriaceae bacterium]|nr:carbon-nitrogen hydrolase family protein [Kofleriaceae bacterium]
MHVTAIELPARWGAPREALAEVDAWLARGPATELVLLPEAALTGYVSPEGDFDASVFAEDVDGPTAQALAALAARHRVHLVAPLVERAGDACFNSMVGFGPSGARTFVYRKRHPWIPETWATPGDGAHPLVTIGDRTVTIATCFDLHFLPDEAADVLAAADLLLFPSAWVDRRHTRLPLLRALAARFDVAVVNANWAPGVVRLAGQGGSCVLARDGAVVATATPASRRADASLP